jgi:peptidoglycan hydrolase-like protein with peptidoglycan-binding domain
MPASRLCPHAGFTKARRGELAVNKKKAKWTGSALLAGGLVITGIAVGGSPAPATHPKAKAAASVTGEYANLDACPLLSVGYRGGCVQQLQADLDTVLNVTAPADGVFGQQTKDLVQTFQQDQHITPVDGEVGPVTKAALDTAIGAGPSGTSSAPAAPATSPAAGASSSGPAGSEPSSDPANGQIVPKESAPSNPADEPDTSSGSSTGEKICQGAGGAAFDLSAESIGALFPAVIGDPNIGAPYLDGNVVRADSSVSFDSWGSCADQLAFQMQSKVCGAFGCHWLTRNHGTWQFLWAHDQTGTIAQQVTMACRPGTNSYRVEMDVVNEQSTSEEGEGEGFGVNGTENVADPEYGPVVQLTC